MLIPREYTWPSKFAVRRVSSQRWTRQEQGCREQPLRKGRTISSKPDAAYFSEAVPADTT